MDTRPVKSSPDTVGMISDDMDLKMIPASEETGTLPMPTELTCDKPRDQDGNVGKPWHRTLDKRRSGSSSTNMSHGGEGGPNAQ